MAATNTSNEPVSEGWWTPGKTGSTKPRWVLRVAEGMVYYGTGSTTHKFCKVTTFQKWIKRAAAGRAERERK